MGQKKSFSRIAAAVSVACAAVALLAYSELWEKCAWLHECLFADRTQAAGVLAFCLVCSFLSLLFGWPRAGQASEAGASDATDESA